MKRLSLFAVTAAVAAACLLPVDSFAQKKHKKKKAAKACATSIAKCPIEGCGTDSDPLLNTSKNRSDIPDDSGLVDMSVSEVKALSQHLPAGWQEGDGRDTFTGPGKEGQPVRVMAWLWKSKPEGGESCNCGLEGPGVTGQKRTDIHMVLTTYNNSAESSSMTAEITPRVRAKRPHPVTWTYSRIRKNDGKYIRVTGYLTLDTHHLVAGPLTRATNWEVHPITKLELCTSTATKCRTTGEGWVEVK
jgi:hypothetical protein